MATSGGYGLGGFTGGDGAPNTQGQGQGGGMDMQGFFGMLMQFLRRYSQGGGSMQPGQFPPAPQEQMGMHSQAPQRAPAFDQGFDYTQRRSAYQMQPARPGSLAPVRPQSQPQSLTGTGIDPMFGSAEPVPYRAPVAQSGTGMTRQAVV